MEELEVSEAVPLVDLDLVDLDLVGPVVGLVTTHSTLVVLEAETTWRRSSQASPGTTTLSSPRSPIHPSSATARPMEATTLTPRLSARPSTSALGTVPAASPSTASSAPTAPSSTSSTSSVTGGSMWTAPLPKTFIS